LNFHAEPQGGLLSKETLAIRGLLCLYAPFAFSEYNDRESEVMSFDQTFVFALGFTLSPADW
jgi:hypothetical protein